MNTVKMKIVGYLRVGNYEYSLLDLNPQKHDGNNLHRVYLGQPAFLFLVYLGDHIADYITVVGNDFVIVPAHPTQEVDVEIELNYEEVPATIPESVDV